MRFRLDIHCDGAAFAGDCPGDLLGEVARILRHAADMVEACEYHVPRNRLGNHEYRGLRDINGNACGAAGFMED